MLNTLLNNSILKARPFCVMLSTLRLRVSKTCVSHASLSTAVHCFSTFLDYKSFLEKQTKKVRILSNNDYQTLSYSSISWICHGRWFLSNSYHKGSYATRTGTRTTTAQKNHISGLLSTFLGGSLGFRFFALNFVNRKIGLNVSP